MPTYAMCWPTGPGRAVSFHRVTSLFSAALCLFVRMRGDSDAYITTTPPPLRERGALCGPGKQVT